MNDIPKLQGYKIQRTYIRTSKYTLTLYIPPTETTILNNGYSVSPMGILYLQLPWKENVGGSRSLDIRIKNQKKILRCIAEALTWFESIPDLYVTQDNILYFNTNYNVLAAKYKSDPLENPQAMKIIPIALECGNGIYEEGVLLSINTIENCIELTRNELQELFDILCNFNFSVEMQLTYQALLLSFMTGRVGTQKQNFTNKFLS